MPRASYLHCPACDRRKAVDVDFDLPIAALDAVSCRRIPAKRCTVRGCHCTSIGDVVIHRPVTRREGKRTGGLVKTPEAQALIGRALRTIARQEQRDAAQSLADAETILTYLDTQGE